MPLIPDEFRPLTSPGVATAEGYVVLDGPGGVAITMTPDAAARTGHSLIMAAVIAEQFRAERRLPE
ncbi:hypothetical protein [Sphingomonas cavernae]|uniref:Uncharacterized protein n=1 Tax=Sphingomonas cavernae TaxID=2320861 RepID=A0A418WN75_9SPHN|nr:hypothetical protein [Sphingomonas cavernae]RJF91458.1 hypothetical protein D3876_08520 [Sphingomonas cavernae]